MYEKARGGHPKQRPARASTSTLGADPAGLQQRIDRAFAESNPPDLLDFGARHRLVVSNHGQGLDRRPRQLAGDRPLDPQFAGEIGRGAKRPTACQPHEVDAASGKGFGQLLQQHPHIGRIAEITYQSLLPDGLGSREEERLDEPQLLSPIAHLIGHDIKRAGRRRAAEVDRPEGPVLTEFEASAARKFERSGKSRGERGAAKHLAAQLPRQKAR